MARCSALFRGHRVEAFGGTFHVPDRDTYPALFAWDSGYHALSLLHLEPDDAVEELTTLYRANRLPDGQLSHQRYVPGAEEHQRLRYGQPESATTASQLHILRPAGAVPGHHAATPRR